METPAQIQKRANQMVAQQQLAQQQLIYGDYQDRMKQAMAQELAAQAAGRAAAAMNSQMLGEIGGTYAGAAGDLRAMGGSLGAAMAGASAADVAAAGATAGNVGAPAPTVGAGSPIAGPTQQGVEVFRGAELPAQAMGTAGQAAQTGLWGLIGSQNLRATQEAIAGYNQALGEANQARTTSIRDLISQRPGTYSSIYDKLMSANQNMAQLVQQAQYRNAQIANAQSELRYRYASLRAQATTNAQKLAVDRWYKQQEASLRAQQIGVSRFTARTGRINARSGQVRAAASAQNAATAAAKAAATITGGGTKAGTYIPATWKKGQPLPIKAIVANVAADYTKKYPDIRYDPETAFAWSWPRIKGYFKTPGSQAAARRYLRKRTKALKPSSSGTVVVGGTGWKSAGAG